MKKYFKITTIVSLSLILAGLVMIGSMFLVNRFGRFKGSNPDQGGFSQIISGDISEIKADISYGSISVETGPEFGVYFKDVYIPGAGAEVSGKTLSVTVDTPNKMNLLGWEIGANIDYKLLNNAEIKIIVPENIKLDYLNIQSGVGNIDIKDIYSKNFVAQLGAGNINLDSCSFTVKSGIQLVAGNFKARNTFLEDAAIDVTVGNIDVSGLKGNSLNNVDSDVIIGCNSLK